MYVIQKSQEFTDTITFEDSSRDPLTVNIKLNFSADLAAKYRQLQLKLIELQKQHQQAPGSLEVVGGIGECIVQVFSLLFGEENTQNIVRFYSNNPEQMLLDVFPYITNVIVPELKKAVKARKKHMQQRFRP